MFDEYRTLVRRVLIAADLEVLALSFLVAFVVRDRFLSAEVGELSSIDDYLWLLGLVLGIWFGCLKLFGFYRPTRYLRRRKIFGALVKAHGLGALVLLSLLFVARRWEVSRLLTQLFFFIGFVGLAGEKLVVVTMLRRLRARGLNSWRVLVVGPDDRARQYLRSLREHAHWGVRVVGVLESDGSGSAVSSGEYPILGKLRDLPDVLHREPMDEVLFTVSAQDFATVEPCLELCQEMGITSRVLLDLPRRAWTTEQLDWFEGQGVLSLEPVRRSLAAFACKRLIDVAGALAGLAAFGVAYLWYAPRIRRDSPGPALFSQRRVGLNGRLFRLYKFRTMYHEAPEAAQARLAGRNEMRGPIFKIKDDPRITPLGKKLRARHLDELPQFWNVLKGEMSLVGTRPPTVDEVERYRPHHRRRLSMKPGVTGFWQLNGNDGVSDFEKIVELDCQYIDSWSLRLDLRVLGRTVVKVLQASGW